ncbi:hypothetical protein NDU88_005038 [Pleurodeles waltl]|uniref:Transmembrane protein n=1 Tax=Pleurodeles waltl TaxID=8319 RepID=A0AAV7RHW2_PLEWA|nr:hypothetical protein NDU88_005038 [Pleurodeles waltl]
MALASELRCSHGREVGVTRCPDDRGAGVSDVTPDFRVRETEKREGGREPKSEESDADNFQTDETTETESGDQEDPKTRARNTDGSRDAGGTENQERNEDTLKSRHVPGGAWLTKEVVINRLLLPLGNNYNNSCEGDCISTIVAGEVAVGVAGMVHAAFAAIDTALVPAMLAHEAAAVPVVKEVVVNSVVTITIVVLANNVANFIAASVVAMVVAVVTAVVKAIIGVIVAAIMAALFDSVVAA